MHGPNRSNSKISAPIRADLSSFYLGEAELRRPRRPCCDHTPQPNTPPADEITPESIHPPRVRTHRPNHQPPNTQIPRPLEAGNVLPNRQDKSAPLKPSRGLIRAPNTRRGGRKRTPGLRVESRGNGKLSFEPSNGHRVPKRSGRGVDKRSDKEQERIENIRSEIEGVLDPALQGIPPALRRKPVPPPHPAERRPDPLPSVPSTSGSWPPRAWPPPPLPMREPVRPRPRKQVTPRYEYPSPPSRPQVAPGPYHPASPKPLRLRYQLSRRRSQIKNPVDGEPATEVPVHIPHEEHRPQQNPSPRQGRSQQPHQQAFPTHPAKPKPSNPQAPPRFSKQKSFGPIGELTPRFRTYMLDLLQDPLHKDHTQALEWYLHEMAGEDARLSSRLEEDGEEEGGYEDLDRVLKEDAMGYLDGAERTQWRPVKSLGSGGFGNVVLWERQRGDGIFDHLAVKDCVLSSFFQDYSNEAMLTRTLNATGCPNFVKVYEWTVLPGGKKMRVLYEFCGDGDLRSLRKWYSARFIATAICYMARGTTGSEPVPGWQEIVHLDIKDANILLTTNITTHPYPTIKLADFGLAYSIPNESIKHYKRMLGTAGTPGYTAPESNARIRDDPHQTPYPFASPLSDIYSLGMTMLRFLRDVVSQYPPDDWKSLDLSYGWAYKYFPYSPELVQLVLRCLHHDALKRPSPLELWCLTKDHADRSRAQMLQQQEEAQTNTSSGMYQSRTHWTHRARTQYDTDPLYRAAHRPFEWSNTHEAALNALHKATLRPRTASPGFAAMCGGLAGFQRVEVLERRRAGWPREAFLQQVDWMEGEPFWRYVGRDCLVLPAVDEHWRTRREEEWRRTVPRTFGEILNRVG
ncbi:hypothetical protein MMC12_005509 [Toensbergia leucococca]|nr:hypothetical protein [Toensbergia leucococca]